MSRPANFTRPSRTTHTTPYQMIADPGDLPERGSSNGGVFDRGQLVWIPDPPASLPVPHTAVGYVDGVGHVLIDHRVLRLSEIASSPSRDTTENEFVLAPVHSS